MPVMNGFDAARAIKAALPNTAIVILSSNADERFVAEAKRIGVQAYVAKQEAGDQLVRAIGTAISSGDFMLMQ